MMRRVVTVQEQSAQPLSFGGVEGFGDDNVDLRRTSADARDASSTAAAAGTSPMAGAIEAFTTKMMRDLGAKADQSELVRLQARLGIVADDVRALRGSGINGALLGHAYSDADDIAMPNDDDRHAGDDAVADADGSSATPAMASSSSPWSVVRVFTKMQDQAATVALSKKIALILQDVKRLTKSMGELEDDFDVIRSVTGRCDIVARQSGAEPWQGADDDDSKENGGARVAADCWRQRRWRQRRYAEGQNVHSDDSGASAANGNRVGAQGRPRRAGR